MNEKTARALVIAGGAWAIADIASPFIGGQLQSAIDSIDSANPLPIPLWAVLGGVGAFGLWGIKGVAGVAVIWLGATVALTSLVSKQSGV